MMADHNAKAFEFPFIEKRDEHENIRQMHPALIGIIQYHGIARLEIIAKALEHFVHGLGNRSEEHTSELQSLMRISYAVFCLKKKKNNTNNKTTIVKSLYTTNH